MKKRAGGMGVSPIRIFKEAEDVDEDVVVVLVVVVAVAVGHSALAITFSMAWPLATPLATSDG